MDPKCPGCSGYMISLLRGAPSKEKEWKELEENVRDTYRFVMADRDFYTSSQRETYHRRMQTSCAPVGLNA